MVQRTDLSELLAAWRALSGAPDEQGWRTIQIGHHATDMLRAGRHSPGNEEALLAGFDGVAVPPATQLPKGRGFAVDVLPANRTGPVWLALRRLATGGMEMFTLMAGDVLDLLDRTRGETAPRRFQAFLSRIIAWQNFMERDASGVLSEEAETGLVGELTVLLALLELSVVPGIVLNAWMGPLDGLHDFELGTGSIEVKATTAASGFPARIVSLDQLDDGDRSPLFMAAVRLSVNVSGRTLPELIEHVRDAIAADPADRQNFDLRLLHAGYLDAMVDRYTRRFIPVATRYLAVSAEFPRLARSAVDPRIREAHYIIDIDTVPGPNMDLASAVNELGAA